MRPFRDELQTRLEELAAAGLRRELRQPEGIDFASNDYLALAGDRRVREAIRAATLAGPAGAPASRVLRGHLAWHEHVETELANFKGTEAALLFPSGYQANFAVMTTLIAREDVVFSDAANHASLIDGLRLARASKVIYPHLDIDALRRGLQHRNSRKRAFIVTESLFSVDGDAAPLRAIAELAGQYGAELIVDDAHATGLYGPSGSGLCEEEGVAAQAAAIISTGGKALGLWGAFVAGPRLVIDYLVQQARAFIFTTAVTPLLAAGLETSLRLVREEPERRASVHRLAALLRARLQAAGVDTRQSTGPIVPVLLGGNERALAAAREVTRRGFDVRAVRPPTVPPGTARLRLSVHSDRTDLEIEGLAAAVTEAIQP